MKRVSQRHLPVYVTQVSLTALLDLVLVVLLVFVVAVPLLRREKLPGTPAQVAIEPVNIGGPRSQLILRIERDQSIWLNKKRVSGSTLMSTLKEELVKKPQSAVLVQMPENFAAGALARLMEEMHRAGVQKTAVEVINDTRKP